MTRRIRLGELLVRASVIDEARLRAALAHQQKWGGRLGTVLVDLGYVSEDLLVKALSKQLGIPRANFDQPLPPAAVLQKVGAEFATEHGLCPIAFDGISRTLTVATADPTNVAAIDQLRFRTGLKIETVIAAASEIARMVPNVVGSGLTLDVAPKAIDISDTPELPASMRVVSPSDDIGIAIEPPSPGGPPPVPPPGPAAAQVKPWSPVPKDLPATPPAPAAPSPADLVERVHTAQRQQQKALRVLLEMLVERGVFSAEEYTSRVTAP